MRTNETLSASDTKQMFNMLTDNLRGAHPLEFGDDAIDRVREQPGLFSLRNAAIAALATYTGQAKMHQGALWHARQGNVTSPHYLGEEHLVGLIKNRGARAKQMAELACAACPLAAGCGIGPDELADNLRSKESRRRVVGRLRRDRLNTHLCSTNLSPERLKATNP